MGKIKKPRESKPLPEGTTCSLCGADLSWAPSGTYEYVRTGGCRKNNHYFCKGMKCRKENMMVY